MLIVLVFSLQASGQNSGLSVGQWARYEVSGDPALTEGFSRSELTVTSGGPNVTISSIDTYPNGTSAPPEILWIDLVTGRNNTPPGFYFAIPSGLDVDDSIYPGSSLRVQRREAMNYVQANREINSLNLTEPTRSTAYRWDSATGIFTEIVVATSGGEELHVKMMETSIWSPDSPVDYSIIYITGAVLVVIVFALAFYRLRSSKKRRPT